MRTTVTLDDDVADKLKRLAQRRAATFKETLNQVLRRGLAAPSRSDQPRPYQVDVFRSALRTGVDPMHLNRLSDELEVDRAIGRLEPTGDPA